MNLDWNFIDEMSDEMITYFLYKEGKTLSQISRIRGLNLEVVQMQLIRAKGLVRVDESKSDSSTLKIEDYYNKSKEDRIEFLNLLKDDELEKFKKLVYHQTTKEKNMEDLMVLIWTMGELKEPRYLKLIHKLVAHPHGGVRRMANSAIGKIKEKSSLPYIYRGLRDEKPQVRQYAAIALGKIGNDESLEVILNHLQNKTEKEYVKRSLEKSFEEIRDRIQRDLEEEKNAF